MQTNSIDLNQRIDGIESKLDRIVEDRIDLETIRISLINLLKKQTKLKSNITKSELDTIRKLKSYQDIHITTSDKGNKTVILNKNDYIQKVEQILSDTNFYFKVFNDNTDNIAKKLIEKLKF